MKLTKRRATVCISLAIISWLLGANALSFDNIINWLGLDGIKDIGHAVLDASNDDAAFLDTHQLIERAGFGYENYYALSDDGYITQLIRIINPMCDSNHLKLAPVLIQHGQTSNSRNFVMQSNSQHRPMPYPRLNSSQLHEHTGESSNRSLALMLANNGYDVWLTSMRGVDIHNQGFLNREAEKNLRTKADEFEKKNLSSGEELLMVERVNKNYWSFTLDDLIAHELPSQIATVLNVTGAKKVSIFGYSNSALTTFAMLSIRPDIAAFVDTYIAAAPVVYYNELSGWFGWFMEEFMQLLPTIDADLLLNLPTSEFLRRVIARACSPLPVRYTVCKFAIDLFFGDSSQFRTHLELPFFGHLFHPTSFKCLGQHLQIVRTHKLSKFDYGPLHNMRYYNQSSPPVYDLSSIDPSVNFVLVSGEFDCWANQFTLDQLRNELPRKPNLDLVVPDYNHLDLGAAYDVDRKVNLPILEVLERRQKVLAGIMSQQDFVLDDLASWYSTEFDHDHYKAPEPTKAPFSFLQPLNFPRFQLPHFNLPAFHLPPMFPSMPSFHLPFMDSQEEHQHTAGEEELAYPHQEQFEELDKKSEVKKQETNSSFNWNLTAPLFKL